MKQKNSLSCNRRKMIIGNRLDDRINNIFNIKQQDLLTMTNLVCSRTEIFKEFLTNPDRLNNVNLNNNFGLSINMLSCSFIVNNNQLLFDNFGGSKI